MVKRNMFTIFTQEYPCKAQRAATAFRNTRAVVTPGFSARPKQKKTERSAGGDCGAFGH